MGFKVFISHHAWDKKYAAGIKENLELHGLETFLSITTKKSGKNLSEGTVKEIESCNLFFLLLSKKAVEPGNVKLEVKLAKEKGKNDKIIPFKLEEVDASNLIAEDKYYLPLYTEYDENLNELINWLAQNSPSRESLDIIKSVIFIAIAAIGFVPLRKS